MINITIIIPHYNSINSLKILLNSIPKKDDIQTIVIDDKSSENYSELKQMVEYRHILFLENTTLKKGAGVCRNIGLKFAKGKWLLFADADDFFTEDFYRNVTKYLESDSDLIYFTPISIYSDTHEIAKRHIHYEQLINNFIKNKSEKTETKLRYQFPVPWSKMIKRTLVVNNKIFFDEVIAMNDIMFSTKVGFYAQKIDVSKDVIYCVTRSEGSLTMNMSKEVHQSRTNAYIRYCNFINKNLAEDQKMYLELFSIRFIIRVFKSKLGIIEAYKTYKKFKKNGIGLLNRQFFNPINLLKKYHSYRLRVKEEKKYYRY